MAKILQSAKLRVIVLPLLGVLGTLFAMVWPVGQKAFCAGIASLVI
ncbi:hypothetical protein [Rhodobacter ferrooxidans]|uniref:Uncharacterized protein n=1 Tax=Rhodobacter ferrooxidans TaxID=371731 RepID=C8RZ55_9RHOB|nr:hypothetical protein [Rhodobacter sp. SW2]EEW26012.1 hypothetical protein Rsw2DRAFT_1083 [Rhodobacter sp. SW2]